MQEKQIKMIRILSMSSKPVAGKKLSLALDVSTRTVINYINSINQQYGDAVIVSTTGGYVIDQQKAHTLLTRINAIPDGYRKRSFYICKKLLLDSDKQIDAFDLCEELCISYSLLKNDIQKMNQAYAYLNIKFITRNNVFFVSGNEADKRKLMNHVLQQAQEANIINISALKQYFDEDDVNRVLALLEDIHIKNSYYVNDFSKMNMMLHILTMVKRIKGGNAIPYDKTADVSITQLSNNDYRLTKQICYELCSAFSIELSSADQLQIYLLIRSNSSLCVPETEETLSAYVGQDFFETMKEIITETEQKFCIKLVSNEFCMRFSLHIRNLYERSKNGTQITNPLKTTLRGSSPFLYDIAIFIVQQLCAKELLQCFIAEDEISFIVLHLGAEIERQNITDHSINCVLIVPEYLNIAQMIARKLLCRFGDQMTICQTITLKDKQPEQTYDLSISVVDKTPGDEMQTVYVSPFLSGSDFTAISNALDYIQTQKALEYLMKNFDFYFCKENFVIDSSEGLQRDEIVHRLCDLLEKNEYVNSEYKDNVFKRENAASTAYFDFAIPHSVSMEASSNAVGVMIAENGIYWNDRLVYVVFLMAISPDSLADFQLLYNILAQILTDTPVIKELRESTDFEEFKRLILNSNLY